MIKQYLVGVWICVFLRSQVVLANQCWRPEPNPNNGDTESYDCEHHNDMWFFDPYSRLCHQPKDDDSLKDKPNLCLKEGYIFESKEDCEGKCSRSKWSRKKAGKVRRVNAE